MLVDANRRIIASSGRHDTLKHRFDLETANRSSGFYARKDGSTVAFHATPGHETYRGLGWYGVILQESEREV